MKNLISYYYNISPENFTYDSENYSFKFNNHVYSFQLYEKDEIQNYYKELEYKLKKYQYFSEIIENKMGNIITIINGKKYVLLRLNNIPNEKISIFDIKNDMYIENTGLLKNIERTNWIGYWENKIDYIEEWFISKKEQYKEFYSIFNFFIGISENALQYLKNVEKEELKGECDVGVVSHDRINLETKLHDYYNPLKVIIDHPSRDISEYIKSQMLLSNDFNTNIFDEYFRKKTFSKYGIRVMYARILFPSFFFDCVEEEINKKNNTINSIESCIEIYLKRLKLLNEYFHDKFGIEVIKWIVKNK